jgi:replication factor A1
VFKDERFEKNEIVKIINGSAKQGRQGGIEVHVGGYSKILLAPEDVDYKKYPKIKEEFVKLQDINENLGSISTEGKVINNFPLKEFMRKDGQKGRVSSIILRDSTGKIKITFWNEDI